MLLTSYYMGLKFQDLAGTRVFKKEGIKIFKRVYYIDRNGDGCLYDLISVHQNGRTCTLFLGSRYPFIHSANGLILGTSVSHRDFIKKLEVLRTVERIDVSKCDPEKFTQLCCFRADGKMDFIEIDHSHSTFEVFRGGRVNNVVGFSKHGAPIYSTRLSPILFEMMIAELKGSKFKERGLKK